MKVELGTTEQIIAVVEPSDATDQELIWTSSDPSIATVDNNGVVTGISVGNFSLFVYFLFSVYIY